MVNKRNSEKLGGVRPSQRQRASAIASLQCRQELTKKTIKRKRIYRTGLKLALESCMSAPLGAQQGE
jgi:hypothetical protein